jgi:hypothetical protein
MNRDYISQLETRITRIERQLRFANRDLEATVTNNEDPEGRNRIKVSCPDVYGASAESGWLVSRSEINGDGFGSIYTPKLGSKVYIRLRDGQPDAGEYFGGPRGSDSAVPEEFSDPNVNGFKTESGIIVKQDDNTGDYSFETGDSKVVLHSDGTIDAYGNICNIHAKVNLNSDETVYPCVTSSPAHSCPLFGPHKGSLNVKASE